MLTRLEIEGFKSFENLKIDLLPFTAIIGSNAAGKSNLFDAIQLLSNLATRDVAEAVKDLRGEPLELFRQTSKGRAKQIKLAAEVLIDPTVRDPWGSEVRLKHTRLRYEVTLERRETRPDIERIQVAHEAVYPILKKGDRWAESLKPNRAFRQEHLRYSRSTALVSTEQKAEGTEFSVSQDGRHGRRRRNIPARAAEATILYGMTNAEFPHVFALREELRHWRLLQLDPALLRRPVPATASDVLSPDGANLAAVLAQLKAETRSKERPTGVLADIAAELNYLIPGTSGLDATLNEASREFRIELTMRDDLTFSSRVISDGTLRVLAILTMLHDPNHRGLICFEEPENGVHPARVKLLVERLRAMVTLPAELEESDYEPQPLTQLLINSHSPVVLSAMLDEKMRSIDGAILFADTSSIADPSDASTRRRTRLRSVRTPDPQSTLVDVNDMPQGYVSDAELKSVLETVSAEG